MGERAIDTIQGCGVVVALVGFVMLVVGLFRGLEGLSVEVFGGVLLLAGLLVVCAAAVVEAIKRRAP